MTLLLITQDSTKNS